MSETEHEYVVVRLPAFAPNQDKLTERINAVAEHGWRLVSTSDDSKGYPVHAVFERPKR